MIESSNVNHPKHYTQGGTEVIDVIEYLTSKYPPSIRYSLGNVIKYVCRAPYKGKEEEDLNKGHWYLNRSQSDITASVSKTTCSIPTFDMEAFIQDTARGYREEQQPFFKSIMYMLDDTEGTPVFRILNLVERDLKALKIA
ncbi:DUF3310 domain-containing protein [Enterococcus phage vB_EfaM_A2]|uniref:DUF3310 domain-containing protein n=1 Tax=Enterococcus phage vB_EfaM_A2 TaxID=2767513 RepID=A0A7G9A3N3_9CAUD|nr:DUF3310 domain-containing protein [Enterococcus phage vB_EfaM_A2]